MKFLLNYILKICITILKFLPLIIPLLKLAIDNLPTLVKKAD